MELQKQEVRGDYIPPEINALNYWPQMRMLLAKIAYLDQKAQTKSNSPDAGCFARNKYLANQFKIKKQTVSKYLMILKEKGDITISFSLNQRGQKQRIIKSKYSIYFFKDQDVQSNGCLTVVNQDDGQQSKGFSKTVDSNQTLNVHSSQNYLDPTTVQKTKGQTLSFDYLVSEYGIEIFSESLRRAIAQGMEKNLAYINGICKNVRAEKNKPIESPIRPNSVTTENTNKNEPQIPSTYEPTWDAFINWSKSNLSRSSVEVLVKVQCIISDNGLSINSELPETLRMIITKYFTDKVPVPIDVVFNQSSKSVHLADDLVHQDKQIELMNRDKEKVKEDIYPNQEEINRFIERLQLSSNENLEKANLVKFEIPQVPKIRYLDFSNHSKSKKSKERSPYLFGTNEEIVELTNTFRNPFGYVKIRGRSLLSGVA
ncbi:hypothetical protein [Leptospira andrefontaineae]|uniref:Uncharacterized protein n=1 Tax=Leptospira andrefontaineae TaxID=2484976 RepID=A0A4R9H713_9LEPT|nr:hypothetical protein [Leptospira andrefontaineae]TGK41255.1 hypothetical protein EHO65_07455 [Leptospira andrefontaineae]